MPPPEISFCNIFEKIYPGNVANALETVLQIENPSEDVFTTITPE